MTEQVSQWQVKKAVREKFNAVISEYGCDPIPLSWSTRMTRTYGMYKWRYNSITGETWDRHIVLSDRLSRHSLEAAMGTMLHEVSHYLNDIFNGQSGHGHTFHKINRDLGGSHRGRTQDGRSVSVAAESQGRSVTYRCKHGNQITRTRRIKTRGRYLTACKCMLDSCEIITKG